LLWDNKFLYVAFDNQDSDIWTSLTKRDDKLWTQEADELMIDADGNGKTYVELQVAPNGTVFDTYLPEYRKYEDAVKGWTVELAIPLADVKGLDKATGLKIPPAVGDTWRFNMFRMDAPAGK